MRQGVETRGEELGGEDNKIATGGVPVKNVESKAELDSTVKEGSAVFVHFWASWCEPSKHMDAVFAQLAVDNPHALFFRVEAEEQPEIAESYGVSTVPFFLFLKDGAVVDKLEGANAPELAYKVSKIAGPLPSSSATDVHPRSLGLSAGPAVIEAAQQAHQANGRGKHSDEGQSPALSNTLKAELLSLINSQPVIVFIKGTTDEPRCGFSRKVVDVLKEEGVQFGSFDILSNESVRRGLKTFSDWATFPQLYVKGELIGGSDIVLEMHESGELKQLFAATDGVEKSNGNSTVQSTANEEETDLNKRLKALIDSKPVLLFMKGTPEEPRCGFSKKVVNALNETGVEFGSFNILSDEEVRQGLKKYSEWPTYPQLYVNGELLGGCDIILEMGKNGELKQTFDDAGLLPKPTLDERLKQLINSSETILFMKGTPEEPKCGFSRKVVNAMQAEGIQFGTFNILSDDEVRQGLKTFSNWPTYPQLYHKGELLGGCDIIMEMKANGELKSSLTA